MSEPKKPKKDIAKSPAQLAADADDAERALARSVAIIIPVGTTVIAVALGIWTSVGPAILVFAAGALLGTITLMWASLRTLGGDAPLPAGLATAAIASRVNRSVEEQKRAVILALKDLEHEHAIGKIDDADYAEVAARYRDEAKALFRKIDAEIAPKRSRAEEIANAHLKRRGLLGDDAAPGDTVKVGGGRADNTSVPKPRVSIEPVPPTRKSSEPPPALTETVEEDGRAVCVTCSTSNEPDAAFCKKCGASMKAAEEPAETSENHAD